MLKSRMSPEEVGIVSHALYKTHINLRQQNSVISKMMCKV